MSWHVGLVRGPPDKASLARQGSQQAVHSAASQQGIQILHMVVFSLFPLFSILRTQSRQIWNGPWGAGRRMADKTFVVNLQDLGSRRTKLCWGCSNPILVEEICSSRWINFPKTPESCETQLCQTSKFITFPCQKFHLPRTNNDILIRNTY